MDLTIKKTTNYDAFKFLEANRAVRPAHVNSLVKSIGKKNLLYVHPIVITSTFIVIDGQHRLEAAKQLKVPIYYVVDDSLAIDDVQLLNTSVKEWTLMDFIDSYVQRYLTGENQFADYEELKSFSMTNSLAPSVAAALLTGRAIGSRSFSIYGLISSGTFKITTRKWAEDVVKIKNRLISITPSKLYGKRDFIAALGRLVKEYSLDEIEKELKKSGKMILPQYNISGYYDYIKEITNGKLDIKY